MALAEAGRHADAVAAAPRAALEDACRAADADLARVRLGTRAPRPGQKTKDARPQLSRGRRHVAGGGGSRLFTSRSSSRRAKRTDAYEAVAERFPGTPWAEEALATLALYHQREGRDEPAAALLPPAARRSIPDGRYVDARRSGGWRGRTTGAGATSRRPRVWSRRRGSGP